MNDRAKELSLARADLKALKARWLEMTGSVWDGADTSVLEVGVALTAVENRIRLLKEALGPQPKDVA